MVTQNQLQVCSSDLPNVLIEEILLWLPAKCVLRFKYVSKNWHRIIKSSYFQKLHLNRSNKRLCPENNGLLIVSKTSIYTSNVDAVLAGDHNLIKHQFPNDTCFDCKSHEFDKFSISESCNGLFCIRYRQIPQDFDESSPRTSYDRFVVYNPVNRDFKRLPTPLPTTIATTKPFGNNFCSLSYFGLGYDKISRDYIVIRIIHEYGQTISNTEVHKLSMRKNSWFKTTSLPISLISLVPLPRKSARGALTKNALHWVSDNDEIVAIDLDSGKHRKLHGPKLLEEKHIIQLDGLCGCLQLTVTLKSGPCVDYEVWTMKEYGKAESWSRWLRIESPDRVQCHMISPVAVTTRSSREEIVALLETIDPCGNYTALKLNSDDLHQTAIELKMSDVQHLLHMVSYVPSLVSLD